ncbi:39S ribosomal protein L21, mitochondrial [Agrilus planipennis]|uniref:Large ribosomal subunit protein bL21m n=1 Tax=Agrilus planipennis TaxID=224129 RepID=A0A1W4X698_AGRPL|nr:39S ribosomal protein L21, mitochondrial [Agrilus planipennis]
MSFLVSRLIGNSRLYVNSLKLRNYPKNTTILQNIIRSQSDLQSYQIVDPKHDENVSKDVIQKVSNQIANNQQGRMFAVVHVAGKQFKITTGDLIVIEGYWPPDIGDKLNLNKVLVLGAKDFSLIGRPIVQRGLVNVHAVVIEKTLSHTKTHFRKKRRKQYTNINCKYNRRKLICFSHVSYKIVNDILLLSLSNSFPFNKFIGFYCISFIIFSLVSFSFSSFDLVVTPIWYYSFIFILCHTPQLNIFFLYSRVTICSSPRI